MEKALQPIGFKNVISHLGNVFEDYYELKKLNKYQGECKCGIYLPTDYKHQKCPWCLQKDLLENTNLSTNKPNYLSFFINGSKYNNIIEIEEYARLKEIEKAAYCILEVTPESRGKIYAAHIVREELISRLRIAFSHPVFPPEQRPDCQLFVDGTCKNGTCGEPNTCCFICKSQRNCEEPCPSPCPVTKGGVING